jgi:tetratricopeptide (TPR) repeat protein
MSRNYRRASAQVACALLLAFSASVWGDDAEIDALIDKSRMSLNEGKAKAAVAALTTAIQKAPDRSYLYTLRARAHDANNDFKAAIADATKAIELAPNDPYPYIERAKIYLAMEKMDQALADATKAIEVAPNEPDGYYVRSDIYADMGKQAEARRDEQKAEEVEKRGGN